MAGAIIGGILNSGLTTKDHIIATARTERTLQSLQEIGRASCRERVSA